ncbi:LysR family transcriptional regulator [Marinomonas sp. SBI22]|jgi:LysR family glycine cleavage system transcriptional activator|uniref:transcriptional regulator GcvA n=1 Tax=unclassified Marinomonas TaxID=196814 RepID=UPI0005FA2E7C|nr:MULTISPECIES: transcriptional regulator GcvA [unclassified Marinomonas]KJZ14151.1 LysR family transcriptional regulator [Marinomonas sp. S3726]KZM44286.1 LysR family transcriptional regulator [Marinomonas sp. SBI22]KZM45444.1 LysR family transcriptional regulator [Marinomonas sp. SBI8L]
MNRKLPSLKSLRVFESVARNKSFRKAADELCVTHSAVSHQIKQLEQELDVFLFQRNGRTISLTKQGEFLYPVINDSFDNIAEAVASLKSANKTKTLTIQTYVTFGTVWLIPKLNDFQAKYPDIRVRISISFVDVDFDKDDVDVGIIMGDKSWSHLDYTYLFDMEIFPVCSPKLVAEGKLKKPEDLAKLDLITVELAPDDWPTWLDKAGVDPHIIDSGPVVDNYLQALEMIYEGKSVVMARESFAKRDLETGRIIRPFDFSVMEVGSWYSVHPKQQNPKPEIQLFNDWLAQKIREDSSFIVKK